MKHLFTGILVVAAIATSATCQASIVTATNGTNLTASATFNIVGSQFLITLANTSTFDVLIPADILTALFFDIPAGVTLSSTSAILSPGSSVLFDPAPAGGVVGGEWAYAAGLVGAPHGALKGIGSAGFGLFGGPTFPGADLDPPTAVNGMNYGITSAGDNPATGNAAVTGSNPFIQNSVDFVLDITAGSFTVDDITNVSFQYGTALTEPNIFPPIFNTPIPEPTSVAVWSLLVGLGAFLSARRK